jgi:hypothetical protein
MQGCILSAYTGIILSVLFYATPKSLGTLLLLAIFVLYAGALFALPLFFSHFVSAVAVKRLIPSHTPAACCVPFLHGLAWLITIWWIGKASPNPGFEEWFKEGLSRLIPTLLSFGVVIGSGWQVAKVRQSVIRPHMP